MLLNNVRVNSTNWFGTMLDTGALWFGRHQHPSFPYDLVGSLSEMRIYNRALSDSEVQQLYTYESGTCLLITSQPRNQVGYWGKSVAFTVGAVGVQPLSYQWQKDTVPIAGATGSSLVMTNLQMADAG